MRREHKIGLAVSMKSPGPVRKEGRREDVFKGYLQTNQGPFPGKLQEHDGGVRGQVAVLPECVDLFYYHLRSCYITVILSVSENYFILSVIHEMKVCQAI